MESQRIVARAAAEFAALAADWIADMLCRVVREREACALALTGGRTPEPVYRLLSERRGVSWPAVTIFFADERAVPPDHPDSNYGMAFQALVDRLPQAPHAVFRMEAERNDLDQAARDYESKLPDRLDLLLLGIGADGHTASLFPHATTLAERHRLVVPARGGDPPRLRLTITPPVIARARAVLVLASGAGKAPAVAAALAPDARPDEVPAALARDGTWLLDQAAAAGLRSPTR